MATISNLHFRSLIYGVDLRLQIREGEAALIYSYDLDPSTWDSGLAISIQTQSSQDSPLASAARLDIRAKDSNSKPIGLGFNHWHRF